jgi:hypothetical protein
MQEGQQEETEFYSNVTGSEQYNDFLQVLGEKVDLLSHDGYMGGLRKETGVVFKSSASKCTIWFDA